MKRRVEVEEGAREGPVSEELGEEYRRKKAPDVVSWGLKKLSSCCPPPTFPCARIQYFLAVLFPIPGGSQMFLS